MVWELIEYVTSETIKRTIKGNYNCWRNQRKMKTKQSIWMGFYWILICAKEICGFFLGNNFVAKFKELPLNVEEIILKRLHGGTQVWHIQHKTLIANITILTKYRRWMLVIVCIFTLLPIRKTFATHYKITLTNTHELFKPNINVLIEKWIPCDLLWEIRMILVVMLGSQKTMKNIFLWKIHHKKNCGC
jgi:hypothetical protein